MTTLEPLEIDYNTFLKEHFTLPPLPKTPAQVLEAINSPTSGAKEIAEIISRDAALVSHLLKVVNSAYYGLPRPIGELKFAIAYLGLGEVSRIALTLSVIKALEPGDLEELKRFWLHSYLTALTAKRLLKNMKSVFEVGDMYSATLLHDVGKLVYQHFFPDHYRTMSRYCTENGCLFPDAEKHFNMPSHGTFGALLCEHWKLPRTIKRACEFHELASIQSIASIALTDPMDIVVPASNLLAGLATEPLESKLKEEIVRQIRRVLVLAEEDFLLLMADVYDLKIKAQELLKEMI